MLRISPETPDKAIKIDTKDKKILDLLGDNGRMSISEIARKTRLSRDTVKYKINRLKELKIILNFFPRLNFKKLGFKIYHVFMVIDERDKKRHNQLLNKLKNHPSTYSLLEYSDQWDLELVVIAKTVYEFNTIMADMSTEFRDIIKEKSKLLEVDKFFSILFPYQYYTKKTMPKIKKKADLEYNFDAKDIKILEQLSIDCRKSTYDISKHVNLSADAVGLRIKKLVDSGVIRNFSILPNFSELGYFWHTFVCDTKFMDNQTIAKMKTFVNRHPNIIRAVSTLGTYDVLMYTIADTQKDFHNTVKEIKDTFSENIRNYATFIAYKEHAFYAMPKAIMNAHKK